MGVELAEYHCQQLLVERIYIYFVDILVLHQLQHLAHLALQCAVGVFAPVVRSEHDTYQHPEHHCHKDENQVACC